MVKKEKRPITRGIKNCRDSRLFKGCSPLQLLRNLTGNHPAIPNDFIPPTVMGHNNRYYKRHNLKTYFMMKTIINFTILLFFFVSCSSENVTDKMRLYESQMESFEEKVKAIQNDSIKQELYGIAMWLFNNEMDTIKMQREPNSTKYKDNPYFLMESYPTYKDIAENYIKGKILYYFSKNGSDYKIAVKDAIEYRFEYPFTSNVIWQEVIFDNLKSYPIVSADIKNEVKSNDIRITESGKLSFPKIIKINYPTDNKKPLPTKVKALVETEIPSTIHQFHFLKNDIGKTQTKNNLSVTLLKMDNNYAEIEVKIPDGFFKDDDICEQYDWIKIEAKDQTAQYLSMSSASASSRKKTYNVVAGNLFKELTAQEKYTPEFLSAFLEKANKVIEEERVLNEKRDKNKQYRFQCFRGIVNEINVDIYDYSTSEMISKEVDYPISDYTNVISLGDFKEIPTTATVYDKELMALAKKPFEIQVDDLKDQITTNQVPAVMSKGSIVDFKYPNLISSKVIGEFNRFNKIKDFSFLDKNEKTITISPDSINQGSWEKRGSMVDVHSSNIEYFPKRFPETPYYVTGIIELNLVEVKKQTYNINNLPEGVLLKGNAVLLDQKIFNSGKYALMVKDNTNRYLKTIHEYSGSVDIDGVKQNKHISYYYGKPQTIEIYTLGGTKVVDYNFKVKLTREENGKYINMWN